MKKAVILDMSMANGTATVDGHDVIPLYDAMDEFADGLGENSGSIMLAALGARLGIAAANTDMYADAGEETLDAILALVTDTYHAAKGAATTVQ